MDIQARHVRVFVTSLVLLMTSTVVLGENTVLTAGSSCTSLNATRIMNVSTSHSYEIRWYGDSPSSSGGPCTARFAPVESEGLCIDFVDFDLSDDPYIKVLKDEAKFSWKEVRSRHQLATICEKVDYAYIELGYVGSMPPRSNKGIRIKITTYFDEELVGIIIGSVIGGLVLIGIIVTVVIIIVCNRRRGFQGSVKSPGSTTVTSSNAAYPRAAYPMANVDTTNTNMTSQYSYSNAYSQPGSYGLTQTNYGYKPPTGDINTGI